MALCFIPNTAIDTAFLLYLLVPYPKDGAVDLPNLSLPLEFSFPALLRSALALAFRWVLSLARGMEKERRRSFMNTVSML